MADPFVHNKIFIRVDKINFYAECIASETIMD